MELTQRIEHYGVMPIIRLDDYRKAAPMAAALKAAGLPVAEVVFRSPNADQVLRALKDAWPELSAGAGTVLTCEQADTAKRAGAEYVLSPGIDGEVLDHCLAEGLLPIPGCATPSDVQLAVKKGLKLVKFFPSEQMGGLSTINALAAPFQSVKFIPTNGVNFKTILQYGANPHVAACGGIFPCPEGLILEEKWDEITRLCVCAVELVRTAREIAAFI